VSDTLSRKEDSERETGVHTVMICNDSMFEQLL